MECPKCACRDGEVVKRFEWYGHPQVTQRCRHCGHRWTCACEVVPEESGAPADAIEKPIAYPMIHCPQCGSQKTRVTSTRRPLRHHKCDDCGHCFRSYERED